MKKRSLYHILYIAVLAWALTACSESEELATTPANGKVTKINVSPYPAFAEDAGTRSVGTFDAGKTAWEVGDEILLMVGSLYDTNKEQHITLRYNGKEWEADKTINWLTTLTTASALYAPDWTFDTEDFMDFTLKENAKYGTSEYIEIGGLKLTNDSVLSIDFSQAQRYYSRLRIAGELSSTVDVTITKFRPANGTSIDYEYSLAMDEKGNAYLYGSWAEGASLIVTGTFDGTKMTLFNKTLQDASEYNKSYVADARLSYKNDGEGTAEAPYKITMPEQFASLAEAVSSGEFDGVDGGIHVALESDLDLSDYEDWTPIGSTAHPFTGVFDGQGHTISGLTIANDNPNDVKEWGLFGMVQDATIQFVRVDGSITLTNFGNEDNGGYDNKDGIGGIAGRCSGSVNFKGCHNNVSITGTGDYYAAIGGIVGFQIDGHVSLIGCANTGKLQALGEGNTSQIPTAGFIGTAYRKSNATTITAEANYCNAEIRTNYIPCVFYGDLHGSGSVRYTVNSNYWMKVNGSPSSAWINSELTEGFTDVNGSDVTWETAMTKMNECLSTNHSGFGYQYVENKGADANTVPLVLQAVTTDNNE